MVINGCHTCFNLAWIFLILLSHLTYQYLVPLFLQILNKSFFKISGRDVVWKQYFRSDTVGYRPPAAQPTHTTWFTTGQLASGCFLFAPYDLSQAFNVKWKCVESRVRSRKRRLSKKRIDSRMSWTSCDQCGILSRVIRFKTVLETIARFFGRTKNYIDIFLQLSLFLPLSLYWFFCYNCGKKFWHNFLSSSIIKKFMRLKDDRKWDVLHYNSSYTY